MGLAASQARLLTITSRKSDCEYQSMAYSHQKIALARDMNIVSAEYQDALTHTKLVYDFYGNGDTSTALSYGLLMSPSKLNNYMPCPITDPSGRIVLDSSLAAAAKLAGIPQEGLGCTPSSDIRDKFIDGLVQNGIITKTTANNVKTVQYNSLMGLGTTTLNKSSVETITFNDFVEQYLSDISFDFGDLTLDAGGSNYDFIKHGSGGYIIENNDDPTKTTVSIKDLLEGSYAIYGTGWDNDVIAANEDLGGKGKCCIVDKVGSCSYWDQLFDTLGSVLDTSDAFTMAALDYAKQQTLAKVINLGSIDTIDISNAADIVSSNSSKDKNVRRQAKDLSDEYVGYVYIRNKKGEYKKGYNDGYNINLSNMTKAFYTYFAQYMQGLATSDLKVTNEKTTSNFVTDMGNDFAFNIVKDADTTGDSILIAGFYDALFNQIATKGWVSNENVNDNDYMQTMLKNGSMYISSVADDDFYYQANYATNTYIKEITDEEGIAVAEAKYNREKAKISSKENILDMKMKNLDTEITALTTEYDTVKGLISNTVQKAFTRYDA